MNRKMIQAIFCLTLCPLVGAQQTTQIELATGAEQPAATAQPAADLPQPSAIAERNHAIQKARTLCIWSETEFLSSATLDRALMRQADWEKLGLSIVDGPCYNDPKISKTRTVDLEIQVNRIIFTHIHTYILSDKATGIVLASGRVRAFDGVVASGPMAEQIVKVLAAARIQAHSASSDGGL
jgi:hypothetical protein